jgi:hypothetical protein
MATTTHPHYLMGVQWHSLLDHIDYERKQGICIVTYAPTAMSEHGRERNLKQTVNPMHDLCGSLHSPKP